MVDTPDNQRLSRRATDVAVTCAAILSTLSFFVLIVDGNGGNELAATIIFYLGSGFFVVFFTTKYAAVSLYARWSYFWPRLLLVVSSLVAGALFDLHGRSYMNIGMADKQYALHERFPF